jgi:Na+/proline symporter
MKRFDIPKEIIIRTIGLVMMSFPVGMGIGAVFVQNWLKGGLMAFSAAVLTVVTVLGVILSWNGTVTKADIQQAFRTATANAGDGNEDIAAVIKSQDKTTPLNK